MAVLRGRSDQRCRGSGVPGRQTAKAFWNAEPDEAAEIDDLQQGNVGHRQPLARQPIVARKLAVEPRHRLAGA